MYLILQWDPYFLSYANLKWSRDFLDTPYQSLRFTYTSAYQCFLYPQSLTLKKYPFYAFRGRTWCTSHNRSDPPWLNMMSKSRKNMNKVRTLIGSLYPPEKYVLRACFAPPNSSAPAISSLRPEHHQKR